MSFSLLIYWIYSLGDSLYKNATRNFEERFWFGFCLLFGICFAFVCAWDWGSQFLLAAISIGLSVGFALLNPTIAACFQTSLLFLRPWELIESNVYFGVLPKLSFTLCVAHIFFSLAKKGKIQFHWNKTATFLLIYAVWTFITTFKAPDPATAQTKYNDTFFKSLFLYMMIMNVIEEKRDLKVLQNSILLTFLGVGLISIYQTSLLAIATSGAESRLKGIGAFSNSNDIAALMVLVMPFGLMTLFRKFESMGSKLLSLALLCVVGDCLYLSQSRGAMLATMISVGFYGVLKIKNKALTVFFIGSAFLVLGAYFQFSSRNADDLQESSASRFTYIKTGVVMGIKNPVLGVGFESYEENFERYATEILYEWGHRTAHNSWILAFAETGIIGLALFILLFSSSIQLSWEIFETAPEFLLSLIGYGITITFLSHTYLLYPYLLYALTGVARRVYSPPEMAHA